MKYQGSCHCGRIAYEVEGEIGRVIDCNCTFCQRRGAARSCGSCRATGSS